MSDATLLRTIEIDPNEIEVTRRLRLVSDKAVEALIASVQELGVIKDAVDLRQMKGQDTPLRLIAGGHRVETARRLGMTITAKVWQCTDAWAEMLEIDDNLAGADLNALDTAVFLARRKALYEKLHPESRQGFAGAAARWDATELSSFASSVAEAMGITERQVRKITSAGSALGPDELDKLRSAPKPVTLADLQIIAKCNTPVDRYDIVDALGAGSAKSAKEVMNRKKAPKGAVEDPVNEGHKRLLDAWSRASKEARRRFVRDFADDMRDLLDALPDTPGEIVEFKRGGRD